MTNLRMLDFLPAANPPTLRFRDVPSTPAALAIHELGVPIPAHVEGHSSWTPNILDHVGQLRPGASIMGAMSSRFSSLPLPLRIPPQPLPPPDVGPIPPKSFKSWTKYALTVVVGLLGRALRKLLGDYQNFQKNFPDPAILYGLQCKLTLLQGTPDEVDLNIEAMAALLSAKLHKLQAAGSASAGTEFLEMLAGFEACTVGYDKLLAYANPGGHVVSDGTSEGDQFADIINNSWDRISKLPPPPPPQSSLRFA